MTKIELHRINNIFFIGIAGDGMSAIAQYLAGTGKDISGSDRQFSNEKKIFRQRQLEAEKIKCFPQDSSGITDEVELVVISSAIEPSVSEYKTAVKKGLPIIMRSDLLTVISSLKRTVAVAGTSGKSTVAAMIYHILEFNNFHPSLITGAGLVSIQNTGRIGNSVTGKGEWLIIEADESDGSLIKYKPETGLILNIDKDHKEIDELETLFRIFAQNSKNLIVNSFRERTAKLSQNTLNDFGFSECGFNIKEFQKENFKIHFKINEVIFRINQIGKHNAENAAAATAACYKAGVSISDSASALNTYEGIFRRHQIIAQKNGITIIDDYAHNPAKLAASIKACQFKSSKLIVWFQPHGYKPTKFLRQEFVSEISEALRNNDEIWMSEIYYAGGTVSKEISSEDLVNDIKETGKNAFFISDRKLLPEKIKKRIKTNDILLLTGARDPSLKNYAKFIEMNI